MYPYGRQPIYGGSAPVPSINPYGVPRPYTGAPSYTQPQNVAPSYVPAGSNPPSFYPYGRGSVPAAPGQYPNAPAEVLREKWE